MRNILADLTGDINADSFGDSFVGVDAVSLRNRGALGNVADLGNLVRNLEAARDDDVGALGDAVTSSTTLVMMMTLSVPVSMSAHLGNWQIF